MAVQEKPTSQKDLTNLRWAAALRALGKIRSYQRINGEGQYDETISAWTGRLVEVLQLLNIPVRRKEH